MSEQPVLSIIVVSFNTKELLRQCLRSIAENRPQLSMETLVVDNASVDGSAEMVAADFRDVRLISNPENVGFARANNQAIREAKGKYHLLLNSDTIILSGALQAMMQEMENNARAGIVGCRLLNPDGSLQRSLRTFPNCLVHTIEILELYRFLGSNRIVGRAYPYNSNHNDSRWIDWLPGACLLIRREALEQVGALDEQYFMYGEDMDWCFRMKKQGWLTLFTPKARVVHLGGGSSVNVRRKMIVEQYRSLFRFYQKHYSYSALVWLKLLVLGLNLPKVLLLLLLERGKPHRRDLRQAYWEVAWHGFKGDLAVRQQN